MGYAKHIGRVGALAVTLGVGVAMATTPGIAFASPSDASSTGDSTSTSADTSSTTNKTSSTPKTDKTSTDSDDADSPAPDVKSASEPANESATAPDEEPPAEPDEETPALTKDDNESEKLATDEPVKHKTSKPSPSTHINTVVDVAGEADSSIATTTKLSEQKPPTLSFAAKDENTPTARTAVITTAATTFTTFSTPVAPVVPQPRPTLVSVVTDFVAAVLNPLLNWGAGSPIQLPVLWGMLSAVRDELERALFRRTTPVASQPTVSALVDPTTQHVLVVGIDGTNLSRVMADPTNENFFELMNTSTNSAPSIVGHTTISNPSWTAILTGAWDNKTGVINNVFTPWTYDKWPTVFNQLEAFDPDIETKSISDWDVIAADTAAGSAPADEVVYFSQIPGDTNWSLTDAAVTAEAVKSIQGTAEGYEDVPNFLFTYLVQVDENGHQFGGASQQYKEAIQRTDDNLGAILDAVAAREGATGEDWTVIVVTDHGHQPQKGFGHGFQTPDETATFVIADGPDFGNGYINTDYEIVDVTPTVLSLFGAPQGTNLDGVPLQSLGPGIDPGDQEDLHNALKAQLASNHSPDFFTNAALSARTIFATIPYLVYNAGLPAPISTVLYVATNVPAQIVAFLTGVHGASIFPLLPPPPPSSVIPEQDSTTVLVLRHDCGDGSTLAAACIAS
jgi:hypothetical protein